MTEANQKEQFSLAFVRAVAAAAGVEAHRPDVDDDSVDICFRARLVVGVRVRRGRLDAQLKCSAATDETESAFHFPLKVKNYNDLRGGDIVPRVLILVVVPAPVADWLTPTADQLTLRRAAYWVRLKEFPATANTSTVTVRVPKGQLFDVAALHHLLDPEGAA